jgi:hypothetical protein
LTGATQKKLDDKVSNDLIKKYIALVKDQFEQGDILVRDLFFTTEVMDKFRSSFALQKINSFDLPDSDKQDLKTLLNSHTKKEKNILAIDLIT